MIDQKAIAQLADRIAREFKPEKIILSGSHAYGKPGADSDADILVVMNFQGRPVDQSVEIRLRAKPGFPVDVLVRTPAKVKERLAMGDPFMEEIVNKGKVLYEATRA